MTHLFTPKLFIAMIDVTNNDVYALDGYMSSLDLVEKMALLHKRQARVSDLKFEQDAILHDMTVKEVAKDNPERLVHVKIVNSLIKESSGINSRLKEFSLLYRQSIDQILIGQLKEQHFHIYERMLEAAKKIYSSKTKKK